MKNQNSFSFNSQITPLHQCNYLPDRAARLEFIELKQEHSLATPIFSQFSRLGFRRSGQHLYRPICYHCQRCIATRIPVNDFTFNRTQRKLWHKSNNIDIVITDCNEATEQHFALYARYICERHSDGDMYPPSLEGFKRFLQYSFTSSFFMEFWRDERLIMVAVCDRLDDGLSAVYTFFDPQLTRLSLGTLAILTQIDYIKQLGLSYLYLGFWIPNSEKMQYKANFHPIELLLNQHWMRFNEQIQLEVVESMLQQSIKAYYSQRWHS